MSNELPEPYAHPGVLREPTGAFAAPRRPISTRRLGFAFLVIGIAWIFGNTLASGTLLAAKIQILDADHKVFLFGLATAIAGATTTVSLFVFGAISDRTRTRFGRRIPWIAFGAGTGVIGLVLIGLAGSIGTLFAAFIGYGILFSALPGAVLAVFPDRVPRSRRGTLSAVYGGAQVFSGAIANVIASRFLTDPRPLLIGAAVLMAVGGVLFVLLAPEESNVDVPRDRLDTHGLLAAFKFPANAPDFYWAFVGRFALLLGLYMVQNFGLYLLTDYIGLSTEDAAGFIAIGGLVSLVTIVAGTVFAGPVSDRLGRRKAPIFVASLLFAVAIVFPLVWRSGESMVVFSAIAGLGLGSFLSVDAALMTEVLPSGESHGKDLGLLNTANNVPQIIAPLATAAIVGVAGYTPVFVTSLVIVTIGAFSIFKIRSVR
ncbi:MFS transporter [Curtobacterium sp. PhB115]|uniref:MFS transporter n=1 Tax=Curtobacterium sp. PhB115 TaxID=2485173 RepID=UPI000F4BE667|nr:MFS transporter [Curtobacterium sp. PhB115]ROP74615.1 Na+/melibiose symporter-like transporter [Curtobacterium sp. PhB115]